MRRGWIISSALLLAACGGDGTMTSSPTPSPTPPAANNPPSITSGADRSVVENNATVYRATASDPDGNTISFSISGGADSALFSMAANGQLSFVDPPDFELPRDADGDNAYLLQIRASDGQAAVTQDIRVTVTNDREGIRVRRVATGLAQPIQVAAVPGDSRVFVILKGGTVLLLNPGTGATSQVRTVTDISTDGERGLLAIAASPDYASTNRFYVLLTNAGGDLELRRYQPGAADDPGAMLTIEHSQFSNHNGGWLGFDGNGLLYVSTGDGGGSGDSLGNGQNVNTLLGAMLRFGINPAASGSTPAVLTIPAGNPFAGGGGAPEIFAYGLRNPFRCSFYNGGILIGDVGEGMREEVDWLPLATGAGTNFGWNFKEGSLTFRGTPPAGLTDPVTEYSRGNGPRQGASIIGGEVYSGPIADLNGKYVFGDFISGNMWTIPAAPLAAGQTVPSSAYERRNEDFTPNTGSIDALVSFGKDAAGNVYLVDIDGDIFVIEPA